MKMIKFLFGCLIMLTFSLHLSAQDDKAPTIYYVVDYMKATPGHEGDYVRLEKTVWKDLHKARIKKGGSEIGWWFLEVRMPSGASTEYDYVAISAVSGWNGIDSLYNSWGDLFGGMTKEQAKHVDSTGMFRTLVRSEISSLMDLIQKDPSSPNAGPPKYWFVNFMDIPSGKWNDYVKMEKELAKPVHQEQIKNGHRAGWGLYSIEFPYGADMKYQAATVDYYNKWSDVTADDMNAMWKKVHPGKNMDEIGKTMESVRKLARNEVWILLDYAQ